jgi:sigma-E factor negative regulatory protein RseB
MMHLHHKVSALIDGELQGAARRRSLAHLRHCADCQHEMQATIALKQRLLGMPMTEPSADLWATLEGVDRTSQRESAPTQTTVVAAAGSTVRRILVGAGSLSLVVLSAAYVVGAPQTTVAAAVTPPVDEANADFLGATATHALGDPAVDTLLGQSTSGAGSSEVAPAVNVGSEGTVPDLRAVGSPLAPPAGDDKRAVHALELAALAPTLIAYRGTRTIENYVGGEPTRVGLEIAHVPDQGTVYRVTGAASSAPVFVDRDGAPVESDVGQEAVDLLTEAYDVAVMGSEDVLGRPALVVGIGHGGMLAAKFWIDEATGLLLNRELYENGQLVRSSTFSRLHIAPHAFLLHLPVELQSPAASMLSTDNAPRLNDAGWTCPGRLGSDFALTGIAHVDVSGDVMMAQYSDGLSNVSIFEQRGTLALAAVDGLERIQLGNTQIFVDYGLPTVAVWESEGTVYTLVTDAPEGRATEVLADLPHASSVSDAGFFSRLGDGLSRMAEAVSP